LGGEPGVLSWGVESGGGGGARLHNALALVEKSTARVLAVCVPASAMPWRAHVALAPNMLKNSPRVRPLGCAVL
jgi:hypothetical protein